jgi:hypothetical protein
VTENNNNNNNNENNKQTLQKLLVAEVGSYMRHKNVNNETLHNGIMAVATNSNKAVVTLTRTPVRSVITGLQTLHLPTTCSQLILNRR